MKKVLLLIFFFIISPVIAQTNLDWKYITPIKENSRIRDIEVTPNNTIYLLNDLGNDNILRSQDNGETWKIVFAPGNQLLNMQMIDDNLGYILSSFGVYKTTDGFQTVTYIDFSSSDYQRLFFYNSNLGFLCGGLGRIYKTTNGGQSFSNAHTGNTNITINDVYFISEDIGFACGTNGKIFKTTNQGASWTAIASPTTKILKRFLFIDDNTAYIVGYSGTILKTTDQGETWTAIQSNTVYNLENIAHINNNFIAVANYGRIVTSSDGTTWTEQQQIDSASLNDFYSISSFAGSYIIGGYGKMFKSQNLADWSVYIKGINRSNLVDISFSDNNNGVAVGDGDAYSVLLRTTDGGKTWINKSTTPGMQGLFGGVHMRPDGKGLAVASHYLLTDDYGDTWPTTGNTNPFNYLTACWLKENGDIFAGTNGTANNGLLRKTATGWTQWTNIGNVIKIRFSDEMVGYTGSQTGRLYKTTDGGNTWTEAGQIPGAIKHLNVLNENIVYANRHRTLDGGQTWNEIPNLDIIILFHFFTIDHGMGLDGSGNVYETINGGETWQNIFNSSITGPGTLSLFKTVIFLKDKIIGLYPNSDIYVLNFPELTASITKTDVSCYGNNDGTVLAEATGGIPPYTYLWTSADNETIEPSNLSSGTYTLTVTDANGNSINQDITINQPLEAIITQHPADVITFNGGNAAYTVNTINIDSYQWQASIDGTTWTDIANGGSAPSYAGTTTNTLTIIQVPNDYTGYSYRVVMKNGVDCTFISNTATLTLGNILEAVNDDFSSVEILAGVGGIAGDVTTNDLLNGIQLDDNDISTTITNNSGLTNTFINSNGDLVIPSTAEQGIYTITYNICPVTFSANCSSAQVKVTISEVMGTKDIEELNLNVYPNPVEDKLFVISDSTILKITIYDINGREIDVENNNGYIDMSSMEASLYYIKIETDRSNSYKTIVKK